MAKQKDPNGYIIYRGPSMLDGKPIVMIATGFADKSENSKTGHMIQTWIIREDINPNSAIHSGDDSSVCGACPHRGDLTPNEDSPTGFKNTGRSCYVKVWQAPTHVWRAYDRGSYDEISVYDIKTLFADKAVRFGSYGDPAAIPLWLIEAIGESSAYTTGYTHQWRDADRGYGNWLMASADNNADRFWARSAGFRTFRVRGENEALGKKEIACPASKEMGAKTNCAACKACGGHNAKANVDISIMTHGALKNNYYKRADAFEYKKAA